MNLSGGLACAGRLHTLCGRHRKPMQPPHPDCCWDDDMGRYECGDGLCSQFPGGEPCLLSRYQFTAGMAVLVLKAFQQVLDPVECKGDISSARISAMALVKNGMWGTDLC